MGDNIVEHISNIPIVISKQFRFIADVLLLVDRFDVIVGDAPTLFGCKENASSSVAPTISNEVIDADIMSRSIYTSSFPSVCRV